MKTSYLMTKLKMEFIKLPCFDIKYILIIKMCEYISFYFNAFLLIAMLPSNV